MHGVVTGVGGGRLFRSVAGMVACVPVTVTVPAVSVVVALRVSGWGRVVACVRTVVQVAGMGIGRKAVAGWGRGVVAMVVPGRRLRRRVRLEHMVRVRT